MKNYLILFLASGLIAISCKEAALPKPKNLIDEDVMVDVLYDIAIIEAIKISHPYSLQKTGIDHQKFVYKKYKIDSTQFAKSDKYYASDVENYAKMYRKVVKKIKEQKTKDSLSLLPKSTKSK